MRAVFSFLFFFRGDLAVDFDSGNVNIVLYIYIRDLFQVLTFV